FQGDFTYWTSTLSRADVIEKMSHIKAPFPFRTTFGYTNAGFVVAGEIIPKATGMQWEDYLKEKIFTPLGMTRTLALSKDLPNATNKCAPYTMADGKLVKIPYCMIDNLAAAGSISSSVNDMSKWVIALLDSGRYEGKKIIPNYALIETRFPHLAIGNNMGARYNRGHFNLYGLGWFLSEYCNRRVIRHTGGVNGFVTSVTLLPEENLGILVFTNTDQNNFYESLKWEIMDAYLGNAYRDYSSKDAENWKKNLAKGVENDKKYKDSVALRLAAALPLNAYTGNYFSDVYGDMKVVLEQNELRMRFSHHPDMYAKLSSLGGNRFYAVFTDPEFSKAIFPFKVEGDKVTGVTVKVADFVEYTPYEFIKK
ncbi:MAG: serine hydrolase, partial [Bacteroidetes bacterium]|nr:serine hydrolase [Bacteroidota bacterium]